MRDLLGLAKHSKCASLDLNLIAEATLSFSEAIKRIIVSVLLLHFHTRV